KIIEAVMSTLAVIGSSMATVVAGPMPGKTPTAVPSAQPTKAHSRLVSDSAVSKPCSRAFSVSIMAAASSDPARARQPRQADGQKLREEPVHRCRQRQPRQQIAHPSVVALAVGAAQAL